jgi:hypothetical protein
MQLSCSPRAVVRLKKPHGYDVGLENSLHELRSRLISRAKEQRDRVE